jgi:hypothetical protein
LLSTKRNCGGNRQQENCQETQRQEDPQIAPCRRQSGCAEETREENHSDEEGQGKEDLAHEDSFKKPNKKIAEESPTG